jgi:hypothetical protein
MMNANQPKKSQPDNTVTDSNSFSRLFSSLKRVFKATSDSKTAQQAAQPAIAAVRFETLEPRVLLSGDVNPTALTIAGAIQTQGEQIHYEFTVEENRRVVFDSLTNRSDLSWSLTGSDGVVAERTFNNTDYNNNTSAVALSAGHYTLTVDGVGDARGDYSLRLIDADAALDINLNTPVTGSLATGNQTAVYRFNAQAGDSVYFQASALVGGNAHWRLIDPNGQQEGDVYNLQSDRDTFTLKNSGQYLLLVEGAITNSTPVDFAFNLHAVVDTHTALIPNQLQTAHISQAGQQANFNFTLTETTAIVFDSQSSQAFQWSLQGPKEKSLLAIAVAVIMKPFIIMTVPY